MGLNLYISEDFTGFLIANWQLYRKYLSIWTQVYVSAGSVLLSFVINTGLLFTDDVLPMFGSCYWVLDTNEELDYIFIVPIYTIILVTIIYCNSCTVLSVWRQKLRIIANQTTLNQRDFRKEKKITVIQAIIVSFLFV